MISICYGLWLNVGNELISSVRVTCSELWSEVCVDNIFFIKSWEFIFDFSKTSPTSWSCSLICYPNKWVLFSIIWYFSKDKNFLLESSNCYWSLDSIYSTTLSQSSFESYLSEFFLLFFLPLFINFCFFPLLLLFLLFWLLLGV